MTSHHSLFHYLSEEGCFDIAFSLDFCKHSWLCAGHFTLHINSLLSGFCFSTLHSVTKLFSQSPPLLLATYILYFSLHRDMYKLIIQLNVEVVLINQLWMVLISYYGTVAYSKCLTVSKTILLLNSTHITIHKAGTKMVIGVSVADGDGEVWEDWSRDIPATAWLWRNTEVRRPLASWEGRRPHPGRTRGVYSLLRRSNLYSCMIFILYVS